MTERPRVLIDTNVVFDDFQLGRRDISVLLAGARGGSIELCVPEVVVQEHVRHFRERLEVRARRLGDGIEEYNRLISLDPALGTSSPARFEMDVDAVVQWVRDAANNYEPWLRERLAKSKVCILPVPEIPHSELLSWYAEGRTPFKPARQAEKSLEGEGYRDALIWATALELAESSAGPIHFLSNDKVFGDPKRPGALAPELLDDLQSRGSPHDAIVHWQSVEDFFNGSFIPLYDADENRLREEAAALLGEDGKEGQAVFGEVDEEYMDRSKHHFFNLARHDLTSQFTRHLDPRLQNVTIETLWINRERVQRATATGTDTLIADGTCVGYVYVEAEVREHELFHLEKLYEDELLGGGGRHVTLYPHFQIDFEITFDRTRKVATALRLVNATPIAPGSLPESVDGER